jgi:two-component system cell cycle response regulator
MNDLEPLRILLVEDSTTQARFLEHTLRAMEPVPHEVNWVDDVARAVKLRTDSVDLVLLDLVLPDSAGIDTFRAVHAAHPGLPIIVLSGAGDEALAQQAVAEGAQDYLFKSTVSPDGLARSIRFAMERNRTLTALRQAAVVDELTGLYNRRGFTVLGDQQMARARRDGSAVTVLFVDVDGLKGVNDAFGHQNGDVLLADLADLMKATFRASDVIGRVGGDEFCILLADEGARSVAATRLREAIERHNASARRRFHLSCSIGVVSLRPTVDSTLADLLSQADQAMYTEKHGARVANTAELL